MVCFAFVDDGDLQSTSEDVNYEEGEKLIPKPQSAVDQWVGMLESTGGAINPDTSYWYLLDFKWTGTEWQYRTKGDIPGEIFTNDLEGNRVAVKRLEADQAEKTLGIMMVAGGNMDACSDRISHR